MKTVDSEYCEHKYWYDYPRVEKVRIDETNLTFSEKQKIRNGDQISKCITGSKYIEYYIPIIYNETPGWLNRQLDIVEKTVDTWSPAKQEWAGREKPKYPKIEKKLYKVWDNDKQEWWDHPRLTRKGDLKGFYQTRECIPGSIKYSMKHFKNETPTNYTIVEFSIVESEEK